jgi:hypothetical protein
MIRNGKPRRRLLTAPGKTMSRAGRGLIAAKKIAASRHEQCHFFRRALRHAAGGVMPYLIRYFREGREQGSTPWDAPLDMMQKIAADGLVRHGMHHATIADEAGRIVWSSTEGGIDARRSTRRHGAFLLRWAKHKAAR